MRAVLMAAVCAVLLTPFAAVADEEDFAVREKTVVRPEVLPEMASIYVVRPAKGGMAIRMWAFADDTVLGLTKGDTYAHAYLEPGEYTFWARAENVSAVRHTVEAGKVYYLKQAVRMGGLKARVAVEFLSDEQGREVLDKCASYSTLTEAGKARAAEIAAEKGSVADEKAAEHASDSPGE
jgi:hypothetical protein